MVSLVHQHIPSELDNRACLFGVYNLSVNYDGNPALDKISFELFEGEKLAIIGPNGAGKSTLLRTIMGMISSSTGQISLTDDLRRRLGYVPQHNQVNWDFPVTVRDTVMMGLTREIGWLRFPRRQHWGLVEHALEQVGLSDYANRAINELSGGQQRRVFIARTLAQNADVLLLDEPFAGVDVGAQSDLMDVLDHLNGQGITIIFTTHDLNLAFQRFDRVMALNREMIAIGQPQEISHADILMRLYGGSFITIDKGQQVSLFVDDPGCEHEKC